MCAHVKGCALTNGNCIFDRNTADLSIPIFSRASHSIIRDSALAPRAKTVQMHHGQKLACGAPVRQRRRRFFSAIPSDCRGLTPRSDQGPQPVLRLFSRRDSNRVCSSRAIPRPGLHSSCLPGSWRSGRAMRAAGPND